MASKARLCLVADHHISELAGYVVVMKFERIIGVLVDMKIGLTCNQRTTTNASIEPGVEDHEESLCPCIVFPIASLYHRGQLLS